MMKNKGGSIKREAKRLLEINGNTNNSSSIFDRLNLPLDIDLDAILED